MNTLPGSKSLKIYLYATLAMLFWGLSFVWFKQIVVFYPPVTIIFLRLVISSLLLFTFLGMTHKIQRIQYPDWKWFLLLAFTQPFCYFLGESFGLTLVSSTVSAVIIATIPLFSPIAAFFFMKERISKDLIAGIIVSFAGIIVMLLNPDLSVSAAPKGILFLFFAVLAAVAYSVVIKKLAYKYEPATIIMMQNFIGAVYFLPLFLAFDLKQFLLVTPGIQVLIPLLELAFFASTLSYLFYIISIKEIGIAKANVLTNLIPIFTGVFSYFVLSEPFSLAKIAGILIVITGIIISQYKGVKRLIKSSGNF